MLLRPYEYDSIVQNPISEADFKWILHRNCEVTEQLRMIIIKNVSKELIRISADHLSTV